SARGEDRVRLPAVEPLVDDDPGRRVLGEERCAVAPDRRRLDGAGLRRAGLNRPRPRAAVVRGREADDPARGADVQLDRTARLLHERRLADERDARDLAVAALARPDA